MLKREVVIVSRFDVIEKEINKGVKIEEDESPYNPEFVKKIKQIEADYNSGKSKSITLDPNDIWGSLGLK